MSEAKHTPGPWRALESPSRRHSGTYQIWGGKHWIANTKCESCPAHHDANARLIAKAPELLDGLEKCMEMFRSLQPDGIDLEAEDMEQLAEIGALIAEAKGES